MNEKTQPREIERDTISEDKYTNQHGFHFSENSRRHKTGSGCRGANMMIRTCKVENKEKRDL